MNDNDFNIPFERAFKRLRVDGDELSKDKLSTSNRTIESDSLLSCTSSVTMWNNDKQVNESYNNSNNHNTSDIVNQQHEFDKLKHTFDRKLDLTSFDERSPLSFKHQHHVRNDLLNLRHTSPDSNKCSNLNDLKKTNIKSTSTTELAQNCSHQARNESDITVDELAGYLDLQLYLPKKMSFMAELAYS